MSLIKAEDSKKWINSFVAIVAILICYIVIQFMEQMGEWFDLEAKIKHFIAVSQGIGIVTGLVFFISVMKNKKASTHLKEVYDELVKVVWPDNDSVVKSTIGILIGLAILSGVFVGVDFLIRKSLELIY